MSLERRTNTQFAFELGTRVRIDRIGRVVFDIGSSLLAIEHFVAAYIDHGSAALSAGLSHEARGLAIFTHRAGGIVLAASGISPGGGMDDCIRPPAFHRLSNLLGIGYIEFSVSWSRDVLSFQ